MSSNPIQIANKAFQTLRDEFPDISMETDESPKFTDLELDIPIQDGLTHKIHLNLQNNDELHFQVDDFWGQWFPCTDPEVSDSFVSAVSGFLSGNYRIEVFSRKGKSFKRLLQSPENGSWKIEYTHSSLHWPCFNPQIRYVQNGIVT